jgi:hypothetical protein
LADANTGSGADILLLLATEACQTSLDADASPLSIDGFLSMLIGRLPCGGGGVNQVSKDGVERWSKDCLGDNEPVTT